MNFLVSLNDLEIANGREGAARAALALNRLRASFSRYPSRLRRALLHAGQVMSIIHQLRSAPALSVRCLICRLGADAGAADRLCRRSRSSRRS